MLTVPITICKLHHPSKPFAQPLQPIRYDEQFSPEGCCKLADIGPTSAAEELGAVLSAGAVSAG